MDFKFNVDGLTLIERALDSFGIKMNDYSWVMNKIADDFYLTERKVFDYEGAYEGRTRWKILSKGYYEVKQQEYPGSKTLERTGDFKKSLTNRYDRNAVCRITRNSITLDSKVKTKDGKYKLLTLFQRGWHKPEIRPRDAKALKWKGVDGEIFSTRSRAVDVSARPPITLSMQQKERWMKFFHIYTNEALKGRKLL